jgi:hypothetical protein
LSVFPVVEFVFFLVGDPVFAADAFAGKGSFAVGDIEDATALDAARLGDLRAVECGSEGGKSAFGTFQKTHEQFLLTKWCVALFFGVFERVIRRRWL